MPTTHLQRRTRTDLVAVRFSLVSIVECTATAIARKISAADQEEVTSTTTSSYWKTKMLPKLLTNKSALTG